MNKITQYLNEHLLGEVTCNEAVREVFSRDASILSITPEMIVHPRNTNDIRKVARFTWQLAEKGHVLPIIARGGGSDQTGGAIGKGIIINTIAHLNKIIFVSLKPKDLFVHVQPGVNFDTLNQVLTSSGVNIPVSPTSASYSTISGAVANNLGDPQSAGVTGDYVKRLELVLANGDLIETTRISKHDLNKKMGLQTFEGELYRKIDGIIEDNKDVIANKIAKNATDNVGYSGISKVKSRDGSFDLTPLIIGSQGTLGIISELVINTAFCSVEEATIVATFGSSDNARDAANALSLIKPCCLELIDGALFDSARQLGKKYIFGDETIDKVLFVKFNDISAHARHKKSKNALKVLSKIQATIYTNESYAIEELCAIREVGSFIVQTLPKGETSPPLINGSSIPNDRRDEFVVALNELADKHHLSLPLHTQWLSGIIHTFPILQLHQVSDKQKTFKLISDYIELVVRYGGNMCAESAEGRLRATAAYSQMDEAVLDVYKQIRDAFDPYGTMNPGVKQSSDLKTMISYLDPDYSIADFAKYSPLN